MAKNKVMWTTKTMGGKNAFLCDCIVLEESLFAFGCVSRIWLIWFLKLLKLNLCVFICGVCIYLRVYYICVYLSAGILNMCVFISGWCICLNWIGYFKYVPSNIVNPSVNNSNTYILYYVHNRRCKIYGNLNWLNLFLF